MTQKLFIVHLYTLFMYGGPQESIVVCPRAYLTASIVYSMHILDFCLVNWINDCTVRVTSLAHYVSL